MPGGAELSGGMNAIAGAAQSILTAIDRTMIRHRTMSIQPLRIYYMQIFNSGPEALAAAAVYSFLRRLRECVRGAGDILNVISSVAFESRGAA